MLFSCRAALLKVVMDSGTVCSDSERFSAVTTMVSNSVETGAVSAASTRNDPTMAATPAQTRPFLVIPIVVLLLARRHHAAPLIVRAVSGHARFIVKVRRLPADVAPRVHLRPAWPVAPR